MQKEEVIERIREAFFATPYPGDPFLQGSFDGSEPFEEVSAFAGKSDWRTLDSKTLDARYCALDFFSEGGFRFFFFPPTWWPIYARSCLQRNLCFICGTDLQPFRPTWQWDRAHFAAVRAEICW